MYIIYLVFSVDKYQNFARQVVISSMLLTGTLMFQLKIPKEGENENAVVEFVSQISWLKGLTLFEIHFIIKSLIFPEVFSAALWMSRLIDTNPNQVI